MKTGLVYWDDEDSSNTNEKGGTHPSGFIDSEDNKYNTEIRFCCRTDGDKKELITLHTELSFFLLAYGSNECQMVNIWQLVNSPNYPEKYPDGQYCSWKITVSPSQRIHLLFTEFRLHLHFFKLHKTFKIKNKCSQKSD